MDAWSLSQNANLNILHIRAFCKTLSASLYGLKIILVQRICLFLLAIALSETFNLSLTCSHPLPILILMLLDSKAISYEIIKTL